MLIRPPAATETTALGLGTEPDATSSSADFGGVFNGAQKEVFGSQDNTDSSSASAQHSPELGDELASETLQSAELDREVNRLEPEFSPEVPADRSVASRADHGSAGVSVGANAANVATETPNEAPGLARSPLVVGAIDSAQPEVNHNGEASVTTQPERHDVLSHSELASVTESLALPVDRIQSRTDTAELSVTSAGRGDDQRRPAGPFFTGDSPSQQRNNDSAVATDLIGPAANLQRDSTSVALPSKPRGDTADSILAPGGREDFLVRRQAEQRAAESARLHDTQAQLSEGSVGPRQGRIVEKNSLGPLEPIESEQAPLSLRGRVSSAPLGGIESRSEHSSMIGMAATQTSTSVASAETSALSGAQSGRQTETMGLTSLTQSTRDVSASNQLAIERSIRVAISRGLDRASIELEPADLGRVDISIVRNGDDVQVSFKVSQPQARELIEASLARLRDSLDEAGLSLSESSVRDTASGSRDGNDDGSANRSAEAHPETQLETEPHRLHEQSINPQALVDLRV